MIKLVNGGDNSISRIQTIFADTKAEVPATGAETVVEGLNSKITYGSVLYTAKMEIAVLKSDDTWEWGE